MKTIMSIAKLLGFFLLGITLLLIVNNYIPILHLSHTPQIILIATAVGCYAIGEALLRRSKQKNQIPIDPVTDSMRRAIAERKKVNPIAGLKIGGKEINHRIIEVLKKTDSKGVHTGSLLTILGSLAGFACQMSARLEQDNLQKQNILTAKDLVHLVESEGKRYFFGDALNRPLNESQYSVWSLVAGAAQANGCKELPDIQEIFTYVAQTLGTDKFGIPRVPEEQKAFDTPANIVINFWPALFPLLKEFCDNPSEWPIIYGSAIQEVIDMSKDIIDPKLALTVIMESAIPMSKIDLDSTLYPVQQK